MKATYVSLKVKRSFLRMEKSESSCTRINRIQKDRRGRGGEKKKGKINSLDLFPGKKRISKNK